MIVYVASLIQLAYFSGLKLHGFLQLLQKFPTEGRSYLVKTKSDKSVDVKNFFKPVYSREQKEKEEEELVMYNFHQFLKKLERKSCSFLCDSCIAKQILNNILWLRVYQKLLQSSFSF